MIVGHNDIDIMNPMEFHLICLTIIIYLCSETVKEADKQEFVIEDKGE